MLVVIYCQKCRDKIRKYGEVENALFEQICEHYIYTGNCLEFCTTQHGNFIEVVRFLEHKKCIISTESELFFVMAKPLGLDFFPCVHENGDTDNICHICFDREAHTEKEDFDLYD